ncbi:hypothetical protein D3C78_1483580 [compost metagenome]
MMSAVFAVAMWTRSLIDCKRKVLRILQTGSCRLARLWLINDQLRQALCGWAFGLLANGLSTGCSTVIVCKLHGLPGLPCESGLGITLRVSVICSCHQIVIKI